MRRSPECTSNKLLGSPREGHHVAAATVESKKFLEAGSRCPVVSKSREGFRGCRASTLALSGEVLVTLLQLVFSRWLGFHRFVKVLYGVLIAQLC